MYATPIKRNGKEVGALMGRRDGYALSNITDDIKYGERGYGYLINDKGVMVAHRDRDQVLNQYNPIEEAVTDKSRESLARGLQRLTDSLREIVGDINKSSQRVAATSEELTATTQQSIQKQVPQKLCY